MLVWEEMRMFHRERNVQELDEAKKNFTESWLSLEKVIGWIIVLPVKEFSNIEVSLGFSR
jgi:hypothetical protein